MNEDRQPKAVSAAPDESQDLESSFKKLASIPSDHKWFRNLAISHIIVETMEWLRFRVSKPTVNIADIRRKYHHAITEEEKRK
ncbi:MAG: hypothetical protein ACREIF_11570 [Chthoniobacterales bacterium]